MIRYYCDGCRVETPAERLCLMSVKSTDTGKVNRDKDSDWTRRTGHYCGGCVSRVLRYVDELHHQATTQTLTVNAAEGR